MQERPQDQRGWAAVQRAWAQTGLLLNKTEDKKLGFLFVFLFIFGCVASLLLGGLFSTYGELGGYSSCGVQLLIAVASLVVECRLQGKQSSVVPRFQSRG